MRQLAALLVLAPCLALSQSPEAQSPSPPPQPVAAAPAPTVVAPGAAVVPAASPMAAAPNWSIGAGLSLEEILLMTSSFMSVIDRAPALAASLERQLSRRTWLAFGLRGAFRRDREDPDPATLDSPATDYRNLSVMGGVRRLVTPGSAPVAVSLLALANIGVGWSKAEYEDYSGGSRTEQRTGWTAGAELGLAVERELTDGLSLRVATPLAKLSWGWYRMRTDGESPREAHGVTLEAAVVPRLELRLAF